METTIGIVDEVDDTAYVQAIPITTAQRKFIYVKSSNTDEHPIHLVEPEVVASLVCKGISPIAYCSGSLCTLSMRS